MSNALAGKRILLTGGSGFLGGHLGRYLLANGAQVINLSRSRPVHRDIYHIECDLLQPGQLKQAMAELGKRFGQTIDYTFHLAGQASIPEAVRDPRSCFAINTMATVNLLDALRQLDQSESFVLISSAAVYGGPRSEPLRELDEPLNKSPYAMSKLCAENAALSFYATYGLPVCIVRLFNVFGHGQSQSALIPSLISQMKEHPDKLFLGRLDSVRDYTYVEDAVSSLAAIAASKAAIGQVVNLGTGQGYSVQNVFDIIARLLDFHGEIVIDERRLRSSEADRIVADVSRLATLIERVPCADLERGLRKTLAFEGG